MKNRWVYVYIAFVSLLVIARFFFFISTQNGGVEHDSGWYLGVARNMAQKGIYASYTNTIAGTDAPGAAPSIHGRFSVQDAHGYTYFPAGVTVGPGFIVPQAIVYKLFGVGIWQNRVVAYSAFCLLIPLLFYIVYALGGVAPLLFFQVWIWAFPQLFLSMSYEAYGEHLALLYLLSGLMILLRSFDLPAVVPFSGTKEGKSKALSLVVGGALLGLSYLTKNLYLLGVVPIVLAFTYFYYQKTKQFLRSSREPLFYKTRPSWKEIALGQDLLGQRKN